MTFNKCFNQLQYSPVHRGAFCQFSFRWIYYYGSNKSIDGNCQMHLCSVVKIAIIGWRFGDRHTFIRSTVDNWPVQEVRKPFGNQKTCLAGIRQWTLSLLSSLQFYFDAHYNSWKLVIFCCRRTVQLCEKRELNGLSLRLGTNPGFLKAKSFP